MLFRSALPLLAADELARDDLPIVRPDDTFDMALDRFSRHDVESLPVMEAGGDRRVLGLVSRQSLLQRYQQELERGA